MKRHVTGYPLPGEPAIKIDINIGYVIAFLYQSY